MGTGDRRQRDRLQRRRGVSMVLVLMAMTIALILGMSFLHAQIVATGMAETVTRQAGARALAESGLAIALAHIDTNPDWRSTCSQGTWIDEHELAGGTVTVTGEDGQDTDGDGLVDGDGDLADDDADPITLTAVGTVDEVTHRIRAVVTPRPSPQRLLLVVPNSGFLSLNDRRRYTQFATWGYEVTCIDESEGQNAFDAAVADADVAYISETVYSATLNTKLRDAPIGIVIEEAQLSDDFGLSSAGGPHYTGSTRIEVVDDTHFITQPFSVGLTQIVTSDLSSLRYVPPVLAPGARVLATRATDGLATLTVIDLGGDLVDATAAAGRRVCLPWGENSFHWPGLTAAGLTLVERSLQWASEPALAGHIAHWTLEEQAGAVATDSVGPHNGTYHNGVTLGHTSPFFLGCFPIFDGVDDFVEVPHDDAFLLDAATVAFRFRTETPASTQGLFSKDSTDFDTGGHLSIWIENAKVEARLQSTTNSYALRSTAIRANTWYHVALTFGPAGMKLYVNGTLVDSDPYAGGTGNTSGDVGNYEPLALGVLTKNSGDLTVSGWTAPLAGAMDDVRLFDRALSQDEINMLVHEPSYSLCWIE